MNEDASRSHSTDDAAPSHAALQLTTATVTEPPEPPAGMYSLLQHVGMARPPGESAFRKAPTMNIIAL